MRLHVVHIGPCNLPLRHDRGGAIERRILELGAAQASRGHLVTVYSAESKSSMTQFRGMELKTIACRNSGIRKRLQFVLRAIRDVDHADVLHFHSVAEATFLASRSRALKLLSFDYFRWRGARFAYWPYRQALKMFDMLLPVSEYCRSEFLRYWRLPPERARVLYNGVNLEQVHPDPESGERMRAKLGLKSGPVILYVGRVCEQKGTDVLIDAFQQLSGQLPKAQLLVAGPADHFSNTNGNSLTARIRRVGGVYLGAVAESELAALYNACDVFVMPTRQDEMFGMAAAEAQACGKPVVCSRHGGLVEVVSEASGRWFRNGDSGELASQVASLLRSPDECQRLSQAARNNAKRFAWARIADELDTLYADSRWYHQPPCTRTASLISR
jgi:glycosyltransferase involved in cell wall biosynthesis